MATRAQRDYRLDQRAERQAETRARIVEAVVSLHEEVGPAQTTVVEVAERAGVSRPTFYSHFPDDRSLFSACSAHWLAANPRPDLAGWAAVKDPERRLGLALGELYAYYEPRERMLSHILRDAALMPTLDETVKGTLRPYVEQAVQVLASGWRGRRRDRLVASLRLAVSFHTWQTLSRSGLTTGEAARLMAELVGRR